MRDDLPIVIKAGSDQTLTLTHLDGFDEISHCFEFTIRFISASPDVKADALIGRPMAIEAEPDHPKRWFHGLVSEFRMVEADETAGRYEVVLRPWLWLLGLTYDCRIFQNRSVIEIAEAIFGKYPEARFDMRLRKSYPSLEYCVQYDESDLDFVQRILEHEGIFYFFEYSESGHTLVLSDSMAKLKPAMYYDTVPFHFEDSPARRDRDFLSRWRVTSSLRPAAYTHTDYNFDTARLSLLARSEFEPTTRFFRGESYRPGAHRDLSRGGAMAAIRREELQASQIRVLAGGTARGLASGCTFRLENHPRESQNAEYLVLRADYSMVDPMYSTEIREPGDTYRVELVVAPTSLPYRPPRTTPRPVMRGPQTATVVGPKGAEIYTDRYSRVKVQFHWDRLGKRDENSSCFVRVSAAWGGEGWGFIQVPRIGQEVIVDFIEGDPDRPIITGRVYNGAEMPPYGLPGNATQSGWKSNSSPGGAGYNELMFEDKAGSELVNFQAQKDHKLLVKNDRTKLVQHDQSDRIDNDAEHSVGVNLDEDVGNNKTTKVGVDRQVSIGSNDTESVGLNRSLTVGANETISIGSSSTETIGTNHTQTVCVVQTITVGAARIDTVGAAETRTVGGAQINTIGAVRQVNVALAQSHDIGASDSWTVGAGQTVNISGDQALEIGKGRTTNVAKDDATEVGGARGLKIAKGSAVEVGEDGLIKIGKDLLIEAGDSIVLKCGSAAVAMKKDGTITIEGKDITITGSGKINVKASGEITMKGSKINQN